MKISHYVMHIVTTSSGRPNVALMAGQLATALEASAGVLQGLFGIEVDEELEIDIR